MKNRTHPIAVKAFLSLVLALATLGLAAESLSALLQKAIFAEETEGNLDAAIKIYEGIVKEAEANRSLAAQAQYRLAVCYQKKGSKEQAVAALRRLITAFPNEGALNEKAQALLRDLGYGPNENIIIRKISVPASSVVSVSPDGKWIAYLTNYNVALFDTVSGESRTVIKGNADESVGGNIVFSPDGQQIAYGWKDGTELYVAGIEDPKPKRIYRAESGLQLEPDDWSSDGRELVLRMGTGTDDVRIRTFSLASATFREIQTNQLPELTLRVFLSSNGELLAYRIRFGREEKLGIYVVHIPTGNQVRVSDRENDELVGWAPGTTRLVFLSDRTGVTGLWSVDVASGKPARDPELVKANVGNISPVGMARNGAIYYTEQVPLLDVYLAEVDFETGKLASPPKRATHRFPGMNTLPIWSHDGQKLGFIRLPTDGSQRGGYFSVLTLNTGEQRDFPLSEAFPFPIRRIDWSHDGSFLLVQSAMSLGKGGVHKFDLESGRAEPLVARSAPGSGDWISNPRIAPDGKSFYYGRRKFTSEDKYSDSIFRRDLGTGQEELVYESPESLNIWSSPTEISPDGKELAITVGEQMPKPRTMPESIKIVPLGGGTVRTLVTVPAPVTLDWARWAPAGKRIVFLKGLSDKETEIWSVPSAGGNPTKIELQVPHPASFSLSPDGRQIAFQAGGKGTPQVWVMENVLPQRASAN